MYPLIPLTHSPKNLVFKKKIGEKLGWGLEELETILNQLVQYQKNVILIKDIEKDESNEILRKKYKTFDFDSGLFYCDIKNQKDYHSYKNAFYEFKPKYKGYDFIIPSKNLKKTIRKMKFKFKN